MKIVHVIPYMAPQAGGPPVVVDQLSRELVARGHQVQVLTTDLYSDGDLSWAAAERLPYNLCVYPSWKRNRYGFSQDFSRGLSTAVQECDVVHLHTLWTFASLAGARASLAANVPFVVMPHGMLDPNSIRRGWLKKRLYGNWLEWPLIRRAARMCYTHPEEERLARQTCDRLPPGEIVELGVDAPPDVAAAELRESCLLRFPQLRDRTVVLFLGRLHAKKGLDLLIPAFDQVAEKHPAAHLLIVGPGDADYVASLHAEIARRGLSTKITLAGPLFGNDKWAAMAASHLFVLPSYQENFALAAVDAIRSGLPVLLSRRVNLWQDIVTAGAGRDCETNLASVASALESCLCDSNWRTTAPQAGARLLTARFNWTVTAGKLEALYTAVTSQGSSSPAAMPTTTSPTDLCRMLP